VAGQANLDQALEHRIETPLGDLLHHQDYGCGVHALRGKGGTAGAVTLAAKYVEASLLDDPRIAQVPSSSAVLEGDAITAAATVQPVTGAAIDFTSTV
jgi:phage baseplate assembly protein W